MVSVVWSFHQWNSLLFNPEVKQHFTRKWWKPGAISLSLPGAHGGVSSMCGGGKGAQHHLLLDIQRRGLWVEPWELCHLLRAYGGDAPVPRAQAAARRELTQFSEPLTSWGERRVKWHWLTFECAVKPSRIPEREMDFLTHWLWRLHLPPALTKSGCVGCSPRQAARSLQVQGFSPNLAPRPPAAKSICQASLPSY